MLFLSDANETFEDLTEKKYPFAFMLASFGYLLTMLGDCVISHVFSKQNRGNEFGGKWIMNLFFLWIFVLCLVIEKMGFSYFV